MTSRQYISREQLLRASRKKPQPSSAARAEYNLDGLERMAKALRLPLPRIPRSWRGYRFALVRLLERRVSRPSFNPWSDGR